jgi:hypothetical protein
MERMSKERELQILKELKDAEPIGTGSSRAAFNWTEGKVVKIALSSHGQLQNETEVERFAQHGHEGILAEIFEYGELIIVAEFVSEPDWTNDDEGYLAYQEELRSLSNKYSEMIDESTDGSQVGYNGKGKLVFYDYGYVYQRSGQVGDMSDWADEYNIPDYAIDILNGHESMLLSDEEEYGYCEDCDEKAYNDELNYDDEDDRYYCDDCYGHILGQREKVEVVEENKEEDAAIFDADANKSPKEE